MDLKRGQLESSKAQCLMWSPIPLEEGVSFSVQRLSPPINCEGDVFLNFTKAVPQPESWLEMLRFVIYPGSVLSVQLTDWIKDMQKKEKKSKETTRIMA